MIRATSPASEFTSQSIRQHIQSMLDKEARHFNDDDDLLMLGLESLQIMHLVNTWRSAGAQITFAQLFERPTLNAWCSLLIRS